MAWGERWDFIGGAEGRLGTSFPLYMCSCAGAVDGATAVLLLWHSGGLRGPEGHAQSNSKHVDGGLKQ